MLKMIGAVVSSMILLCLVSTMHGEKCPEGEHTCASGMTCCLLPSGGKGCCPYSNATCCDDRVHCCPQGSKCVEGLAGHCASTAEVKADSSHTRHSTHQKLLSHAVPRGLASEHCVDGSQCPDNNTCCSIGGGEFGCCGLPKAVCCVDKLHCCPFGSLCDQGGFCKQTYKGNQLSQQWYVRLDKVSKNCPGGSQQCPQGSTCCSVGEGEWGCCPMPNAACCSDMKHCCPNGYRCVSGECIKKKHIFLP